MKILLYGDSWEEYKELITVAHKLESEGAEVAAGTSNEDLLLPLSVGKLLVVNHKKYYYDYVVVTDKKRYEWMFDKERLLGLEELEELL